MPEPLNSGRRIHNPVLSRIIEEGRTSLPSGITTSGALTPFAQNVASMIRDNRDREKREIADLNNRLARYVEKVRFLEAQNRVLENDIGLFRQASHIHEDRIRIYFEAEKTSCATLVRENTAKIQSADQNIRKLEPEVLTARKTLHESIEHKKSRRLERKEQLKRLSDLEAENAYLKRLTNDCEEEKSHVSREISHLKSEIKRVQAHRDKEIKERTRFQTNAKELLVKVNKSISVHEINIREEINHARRDSNDKNKDYFHKELHAAMKEIRDQFEKESRNARKTWEEWYKKKTTEIKKGADKFSSSQAHAREEVLRIRSMVNECRVKISDAETLNQQLIKRIEEIRFREEEDLRLFEYTLTEKENAVIKMREECTKLSVELDSLCDNHINLNNEITHYRKLMESAEHVRTTYQSNVVIDAPSPVLRTTSYHNFGSAYNVYSEQTYESDNSTINSQQFKSSSKGDIKFVDHDSQSIRIENCNSQKSTDLSNWKIHHYSAGALIGSYIFPIATHIQPYQKISVHSATSENLLDDHVAYMIRSFDFSKNSKTVLVDDADEEVGWYAHVMYNH